MKICIIGGTGTLGTELTRQLLKKESVEKILILSRNEHNQKKHFNQFKSKKLEYFIADIKDVSSLFCRLSDVDVCFHVAALKHVDTCELNPIECVNINTLGTINIIRSLNRRTKLVFSTSDKAVMPINSYGMAKAISENIIKQYYPKYKIFRWGNVVGSQGSAINIFRDKLLTGELLPVTDMNMTRFWISIEDAVKFMIAKTFLDDENGVFIPEMKAASVVRVIRTIEKLYGKKQESELEIVGIRPGEKLHELLEVDGKDSSEYEHYTDKELLELITRCL